MICLEKTKKRERSALFQKTPLGAHMGVAANPTDKMQFRFGQPPRDEFWKNRHAQACFPFLVQACSVCITNILLVEIWGVAFCDS
jgi:hypothetical protein